MYALQIECLARTGGVGIDGGGAAARGSSALPATGFSKPSGAEAEADLPLSGPETNWNQSVFSATDMIRNGGRRDGEPKLVLEASKSEC